jgi:hypothetical protein
MAHLSNHVNYFEKMLQKSSKEKAGTISRRKKYIFRINFFYLTATIIMTSGRMAYKTYFENIITKTKIFFFRFTMSQNVLLHHKQTIEPTG